MTLVIDGQKGNDQARPARTSLETPLTRITVTVDGATYSDDVEPRMLLVHYLRERLGKTGTVIGCDTSNCGGCTVHLGGGWLRYRKMHARRAPGKEHPKCRRVSTHGNRHAIQKSFQELAALQ